MYTSVIQSIENLPHYREFTCRHCGYTQRVYSLTIQASRRRCGTQTKLRAYASVGAEIEDVIDTVLAWLGEGKELELAMERKRMIAAGGS